MTNFLKKHWVAMTGATVLAGIGVFALSKSPEIPFQSIPINISNVLRPTIGTPLQISGLQPPVGTNPAAILSSCNYFEPFLELSFLQDYAANKQMSFQHNCTATYGNYGPFFPNTIQNTIEISPAGQILQHILQIWTLPNSVPTESYNVAVNITNGGFLKAGSKLRFWERSNTGTFLAGMSHYDPAISTWRNHVFPIPTKYGKIRWSEFDMVSNGFAHQASDGYYFLTNTTSGTIVYQGYATGTNTLVPVQSSGQLSSIWCNYQVLTNEGSNMGYGYPPAQTTNTKLTQNFAPNAVMGVGGGGGMTCSVTSITLDPILRWREIATIAVTLPGFSGTITYADANSPGIVIGTIPMNSGYGSFQLVGAMAQPRTLIIYNSCTVKINF